MSYCLKYSTYTKFRYTQQGLQMKITILTTSHIKLARVIFALRNVPACIEPTSRMDTAELLTTRGLEPLAMVKGLTVIPEFADSEEGSNPIGYSIFIGNVKVITVDYTNEDDLDMWQFINGESIEHASELYSRSLNYANALTSMFGITMYRPALDLILNVDNYDITNPAPKADEWVKLHTRQERTELGNVAWALSTFGVNTPNYKYAIKTLAVVNSVANWTVQSHPDGVVLYYWEVDGVVRQFSAVEFEDVGIF